MAKNTPTAIVSGAGWIMSFTTGVSNGLLARGMTHEQIHALVTDEGKERLERGIDGFVNALAGPAVPTFDLVTGTFRWETNYNESITTKIAMKDPNSVAWATDYATDEKFPDERKGKKIVSGRVQYFEKVMSQEAIELWAKENNKILARPKELIDFSRAFPRPALDEHMPLAAPGQFWQDSDGDRGFLYLGRGGAERELYDVWFGPEVQWDDDWGFLVLDKVSTPV